MSTTISLSRVREEARLLFALVDAIACDGRITGSAEASQWQSLQRRVNSGSSYESEGPALLDLLIALERSGAIAETWMEKRWRATAARLGRIS